MDVAEGVAEAAVDEDEAEAEAAVKTPSYLSMGAYQHATSQSS